MNPKQNVSVLFFGAVFLALATSLQAQTNAPSITVDGKSFTDSNQNGKLDMWEDTRLAPKGRIDAIVKEWKILHHF